MRRCRSQEQLDVYIFMANSFIAASQNRHRLTADPILRYHRDAGGGVGAPAASSVLREISSRSSADCRRKERGHVIAANRFYGSQRIAPFPDPVLELLLRLLEIANDRCEAHFDIRLRLDLEHLSASTLVLTPSCRIISADFSCARPSSSAFFSARRRTARRSSRVAIASEFGKCAAICSTSLGNPGKR